MAYIGTKLANMEVNKLFVQKCRWKHRVEKIYQLIAMLFVLIFYVKIS